MKIRLEKTLRFPRYQGDRVAEVLTLKEGCVLDAVPVEGLCMRGFEAPCGRYCPRAGRRCRPDRSAVVFIDPALDVMNHRPSTMWGRKLWLMRSEFITEET